MTYRKNKYEEWVEKPERCKTDFEAFVKKRVVSEINESSVWMNRHMEKANHNLDFAGLVQEFHKTGIKERFPGQTFYDWATIGYYYAIYHAGLALLAHAGYKSKSHMATLCGIILYYYHKNKSLEKRHIEILGSIDKENVEQFIEAQGLRERASYGVSVSFEERLCDLAKGKSVDFVNKAKELLKPKV